MPARGERVNESSEHGLVRGSPSDLDMVTHDLAADGPPAQIQTVIARRDAAAAVRRADAMRRSYLRHVEELEERVRSLEGELAATREELRSERRRAEESVQAQRRLASRRSVRAALALTRPLSPLVSGLRRRRAGG